MCAVDFAAVKRSDASPSAQSAVSFRAASPPSTPGDDGIGEESPSMQVLSDGVDLCCHEDPPLLVMAAPVSVSNDTPSAVDAELTPFGGAQEPFPFPSDLAAEIARMALQNDDADDEPSRVVSANLWPPNSRDAEAPDAGFRTWRSPSRDSMPFRRDTQASWDSLLMGACPETVGPEPHPVCLISWLVHQATVAQYALREAIEDYDYLIMGYLAGAASACRKLIRLIARLRAGLEHRGITLAVKVAVESGLGAVKREVQHAGLSLLPSLREPSGASLWAACFQSSKRPALLVVNCKTGGLCCRDAMPHVQLPHSGLASFPWVPRPFSERFDARIAAAAARAARTGDFADSFVAVVYVHSGDTLDAAARSAVVRWIASATVAKAPVFVCYATGNGSSVPEFGAWPQLSPADVDALGRTDEFSAGCALYSPRSRWRIASFDFAELGSGAPLWGLPAGTLARVIQPLSPLNLACVHTHPLFVVVNCGAADAAEALMRVAAQAVLQCSSEASRDEATGGQATALLTAFAQRGSPHLSVLFNSVGDLAQDSCQAVLLLLSLDDLKVSKVVCHTMPDVEYIAGYLHAYMRNELLWTSLGNVCSPMVRQTVAQSLEGL